MTDQEKIREMLKNIIPVLNVNRIKYWIDCGTLLGVIRDGDVIEWDDDGDISYLYSPEQLTKLRICVNWICSYYGYHLKIIRKHRPRIYYSADRINEPWIDFYAWVDKGTDSKFPGKYTNLEAGFLKALWPTIKHIGQPQLYTWGDIQVYIPEYAKARLKQMYKNWKKPNHKMPYWG